MNSDYYINLHFNQAIPEKTGYAFKIGDKGCTFYLHCVDLDPTDMFPHIVFNHPNNTCVEGIPIGSGRDYEYTIQGNEFGVCGKTVVDLKFYDNDNDATQRISTASFMIEIIPDTYTPFEEASSSYADSLERAREEIDAAILDLQGAEHDLEEAEGDLDNMSGQFADTLQDYIDAFGNTGPINPRGEYDPTEPYVPRDAVEYTAGGKTLTYINRSACTGIAPTDPDYGAAHWQIMIDVSVGGSFSALSDVSVDPQTLADGQVPVYDATGQVWENKTILEDSLTSTATNKALTAAKGKALQDNKQPKNLATSLTIDGTTETTVEGALDRLNTYAGKIKGNLSHENILVNGFFEVNEKNFTALSGFTNQITVNSWLFNSNASDATAAVTYSDGIITLSDYAFLDQRIGSARAAALAGKTLTMSVMLSDGTIHSGTVNNFDPTTDTTFTSDQEPTLAYKANNYAFRFYVSRNETVSVKAVFLEPGPISTLASAVKPNYTSELLRCQKADMAQIAYQNIDATARKPYSAGQYFFNADGEFCKAKVAISSGQTFTEGTNYEKKTIGEELAGETGTFTLNYSSGTYTDGFTTQTNYYKRIGGLVIIRGELKLAGTPDSSHSYVYLSGIPFNAKRYDIPVIGTAYIPNSGAMATVRITTADKIQISFTLANGTYPTSGQLIDYTIMYEC